MRSRIGYKLVIAVILFSSLITLITTAIQIYLDYRVDMARVNNYKTLIKQSYLKSITTSVWMFDDGQINTQLNGLLHLPDMEHLEINGNEGYHWSAGSAGSKYFLTKEFPLLYEYKGKNVSIGYLKATITLDGIYAHLLKKALTILAANTVTIFLVAGFILLIFQYSVTRHLNSLSSWLKNLNIGKSFEKFRINRPRGKPGKSDELDEVVNAINEMQNNLENSLNDLINSEKKYKILAENIPLKVFHKDTECVFVACNKNFAGDLGIDADRISGKTDYDFFPKELADKYRNDDKRIMESEIIESFEEQYIGHRGKGSVIRTIKAPIRDENNKVTGLLGIFTDVTELKMAENALKESEARFRRLLESLEDSHFFYSLDPLGNYTYLSRSVTNVLGYNEDEFLTHYTRFLTDNPINNEAAHYLEMSISGEKQPLYEIEIYHKNGSSRRLQLTSIPVIDNYGKVISIEGLAHDVTENKRIEDQLRQAQKMEAIGTLAGGIAHDFNNILNIILGYAEIAKDESPEVSALYKDLDMVLQAGHRAKDLVKQILAFSHQTEYKRIAFQPSSIIKEALKMLRHSIPTTIEIREDIDPHCNMILADPIQIHQILMNLCTNAFHAMEQTGGTMYISLKNLEIYPETSNDNDIDLPEGEYIELIVKDTGPGIPPAIKDRIFDPYFTTKGVGKGTGMGLSIVHGIVQSYEGKITVESKHGEGAVFHVFLPVTEKKQEEEKLNGEIQGGTESILLIDDEENLARMSRDMLTKLGYNVTVKLSSSEALETFRENPGAFDLVITDQTMPGMTGANLATRILNIRPDIPIILCTGYSTLVSEEKAKAMGIREFALKPLVKKDIAFLIRRALDKS